MEIENLYKLCFNDKGERNFHIDKFYRLINKNIQILNFGDNSKSDRILFEFGINLVENLHYFKAIEYLKNSILLLEDKSYFNDLIEKESYLKESRFQLGVAYYYSKDLVNATDIFKQLYADYNDDRTKDWLKASIHWKYQRFINYIWVLAGLSLLLHYIFSYYNKEKWDELFLLFGISLIITTFILMVVLKIKQKKIS